MLVTSVVALFSLPMFRSFLDADMYALWGYISTFTGMFGFADLGLGVAVGRYISVALGKNDSAAVRGYWGTGNLILLPFLSLVTVAFIVLGVWLGPKWYNVTADHVGLMQACFVAGGFGVFFGYYGTYWLILSQAHLDFKFISLVRVIMTLLQILPALGLAFYTHNPFYLVAWSALIGLLQLAVFVWHARRHYHLGLNLGSASLGYAREMAAYTGKMFAGLAVSSFFVSIDRTILGKRGVLSDLDFSNYFMAGNIAQRLQSLSVSVMGPVLYNASRVADQGRAAAVKIYDETFAFMFEWYLLAALWLSLWHPGPGPRPGHRRPGGPAAHPVGGGLLSHGHRQHFQCPTGLPQPARHRDLVHHCRRPADHRRGLDRLAYCRSDRSRLRLSDQPDCLCGPRFVHHQPASSRGLARRPYLAANRRPRPSGGIFWPGLLHQPRRFLPAADSGGPPRRADGGLAAAATIEQLVEPGVVTANSAPVAGQQEDHDNGQSVPAADEFDGGGGECLEPHHVWL